MTIKKKICILVLCCRDQVKGTHQWGFSCEQQKLTGYFMQDGTAEGGITKVPMFQSPEPVCLWPYMVKVPLQLWWRILGFRGGSASKEPACQCRSPPGSSVNGILQARILEWVAMPSSRGSSPPGNRTLIACISCIDRRVLYSWATRKPQIFTTRAIKELGNFYPKCPSSLLHLGNWLHCFV